MARLRLSTLKLARDRERAMPQGFTGGVDAVGLVDQAPKFLAQGVQRALGLDALFAQPGGERVKEAIAPVILPIDAPGGTLGRLNHERAAGPRQKPAQDV